MPEPLPRIHIVVTESPVLVLERLAVAAKQVESFKVEFISRPAVAPGLSAVNVRYGGATRHEGLDVQFIAFDDEPGRISVEVRASRWAPADPPTYATYVRAAKLLTSPVLQNYRAAHGKPLRTRIPKPQDISLQLPPRARKLFIQFAGAANTSSLHPNDWRRFYAFVRKSRFRQLEEAEMAQLLIEHEFPAKQAWRIAEIYVHLCQFKVSR
jgi:hypothetical protein